MRRFRNSGNFFLCLLINLLFHLEGSIPAWILLGLHYWLDWPLWPFWAALAVWVAVILLRMQLLRAAVRVGNEPDPPKKNKNPYSVKSTDNDTE